MKQSLIVLTIGFLYSFFKLYFRHGGAEAEGFMMGRHKERRSARVIFSNYWWRRLHIIDDHLSLCQLLKSNLRNIVESVIKSSFRVSRLQQIICSFVEVRSIYYSSSNYHVKFCQYCCFFSLFINVDIDWVKCSEND
jgi:hypothetical protein